MPAKPYAFLKDGANLLDLSALSAEIVAIEERNQAAYDTSNKLKAEIVAAQSMLLDSGVVVDKGHEEELERRIVAVVGATATRAQRDGALQYRVEEFVRYKAFVTFLEDGTLMPPSATPYATDEEYLLGACMGLAKDLAHYGLGRATARDAESVHMAKALVQDIQDYLLQFDFRNGPLRRNYDGTKYALKSLETLLYELAVTGTSVTTNDDGTGQKPAKMAKLNISSERVAEEELKCLRERMEHRDNLRENLIKRCRDGQKAAKQAIYALHRGDAPKAKALIDQCEVCIQDLSSTIEEEPQLRYGSFANMVEEYAEAKFFYAWLYGDSADVSTNRTPTVPAAKMLQTDDFVTFELEPKEYLGGLCDLTGEVGRFAVQRATQRDKEGVMICLQTNKSILTALQMMPRFPKDISKKMGQNEKSVEKLERILYELSLSEATGRNMKTESMDIEPESKGGGDDEN